MTRPSLVIRNSFLASLLVGGVAVAVAKNLDAKADGAPKDNGPAPVISANVGALPASVGAASSLAAASETALEGKQDGEAAKKDGAATKKDGAAVKKDEKPAVEIDPKLGIVEGVVRLKGDKPELDPEGFKIPDNNPDRAKCTAHAKDERLLLGKKNELKNVVVYIEDYKHKGPKRPKPRKLVLDNKGCTFVPHVFATTIGSKITVTNADSFIHNTRGLLSVDGLNIAVPPKGKLPPKTLRKAGWGIFKCDFHPWMTAHAHVFTHEMFDISSEDGTFRVVNVPPGKYKLQLWHEALENTSVEVTVEAGKTTKIEAGLEAYKD